MSFVLERNARSIGIRDLTIAAVIAFCMIGLTISMFARGDVSYIILCIFWPAGLLVMSIFFKNGQKFLASTGVWRVTVDTKNIIWEAPKEDDKGSSFSYRISDIAYTQTLQKKKSGGGNTHWDFSLVLKNGKKHKLPRHAGINSKLVFNALEKLGIEQKFKRILT